MPAVYFVDTEHGKIIFEYIEGEVTAKHFIEESRKTLSTDQFKVYSPFPPKRRKSPDEMAK